MRYISQIEAVPEGLTGTLLHVSFGVDDDRFSVTMHDMDSGEDEKVRPSSIPYRPKLLGYCEDISYVGGVVVKHSDKTAKLHRYIKSAVTRKGAPAMRLFGVDSYSIYDRGVIEKESNVVAVNTFNTIFRVGGELGSVAVKQDGGGSAEVMPLYDALGYLISRIGLNLMLYDEIRLYSELYKYKTIIGLEHGAEADRFFMKMFLDVMKK